LGPVRDRYANRITLALVAAGVAVSFFGVIAYFRVASQVDPSVRGAVVSSYVGLVLTTFVSLALVGATVGSNTAITLRVLSSKARRMEDGEMDIRFDTERTDEFGDLAAALASMRDALVERIEEAERRRRETERLNRDMRSKAEHYQTVLDAVTNGDLSKRVDPESDVSALQSIGESINETVAELEAATDEITRQMESLSANSEEVAASANELAATSERAARTGTAGREAAEVAIKEMTDVEDEAENAVEEIERLREEMAEIEEIIGVITEIARRTNILAVNARIESSRSEATGQGYSVVADEIRELAEEAQDAAGDVEQRIDRIRAQTEDTANDITSTRERADEAADTVTEAMDALDTLVEYVEDVDRNAQNISLATDDQANSVQSVAQMVETLASAGERDLTAEDFDEQYGFDKVQTD
jgi:methyl-accepting chemotaxis protein